MKVIEKIKEIITNYTGKPNYLSTSKVELQILSNSLVHTDWDCVLDLEEHKVIIRATSKQIEGYVMGVTLTSTKKGCVLVDYDCTGSLASEDAKEEAIAIIKAWLKGGVSILTQINTLRKTQKEYAKVSKRYWKKVKNMDSKASKLLGGLDHPRFLFYGSMDMTGFFIHGRIKDNLTKGVALFRLKRKKRKGLIKPTTKGYIRVKGLEPASHSDIDYKAMKKALEAWLDSEVNTKLKES
jgi:hypothetical protein